MAQDKQWEDKPGEGYAHPAKNKTQEWHDDFSGQIIIPPDAIPGKKYWFSVKDAISQAGNPYRRVKINDLAREQPNQAPAPAPAPAAKDISELEDDLPF